jgi:hypothetical protein
LFKKRAISVLEEQHKTCLCQSVTTNIATEFIRLPIFNFFPAALQPNSLPDRLFVQVSGSHIIGNTHGVWVLRTSDQLVAEAATNTTHNKHKKRTPMPSAGIKPATQKIKRLQNYAYGKRDRLSHPHT